MKEYHVYHPGRFGMMDMVHGVSDPSVASVLNRTMAVLAPMLRRRLGVYSEDLKGLLRHQSPYGGEWHRDGRAGSALNVLVTLQDISHANGATAFQPFDSKTYVVPELPAGSLIVYDYGVLHRAFDRTGLVPSARWLLYQVVTMAGQRDIKNHGRSIESIFKV
eukprot:gnl/MRDRNA2_/MRDRNA2_54482_c0_seq1.p1 gnl/MRDRNA2_/MRDRNA2_54482_c0~~gnl/MRDRNA2_/MRDRNA2_54482_c0_seq1.p1  ORF type:complete len:163 (+),score=17.20 gnl/MRDRNA2_/MRDRNA2_54482_c0_seq1:135-623(+)